MKETPPSVTIVGAGIAGMSAALRLLNAGCSVTVIEKTDRIGGQFGAVKHGTRYHEHAFHIFADWCENFFAICKDIELDRETLFAPRPAFLTLEPLDEQHKRGFAGREETHFRRLEYLGAPAYFWKNANAGVAHWSDMVIYQYSVLDFLADESLDEEDGKEFLNRVSVNGFIRSRDYASDMAALLHHELLLKVFAVPSYRTSARAYQTYLRHSAAFPPGSESEGPDSRLVPNFWAMRGNVYTHFWEPFLKKLKANRRFKLRPNEEVSAIRLTRKSGTSGNGPQEVSHIVVGKKEHEVVKLLLAVPPAGLNKILRNSPDLAAAAPELLGVGQLEAMPVPALNLYFKKNLVLPEEHITLLDPPDAFYNRDSSLARKNGIASEYGLSLVDHSRLWPELEGKGKTVLSVLASDAKLLMEEKEDVIKTRLIKTLQKYIRFTDEDIDHAHLQTHRGEPLFVNTDGSWEDRPEARLDEANRKFPRVQEKVSNLFLAGDYCRSKVDITSVEGAIVTGISAAHLIWNEVKAPIPLKSFDRDQVRRAKALLDGWIGLATQRARQYFLAKRREVEEKSERAMKKEQAASRR
jgi:zeta-carotene desaturase